MTAQGLPWVEPSQKGFCKVTFFWRDPQGNETTSACQHVWININCITDHHQALPPQSLQRLAGTDIWYWQTELRADWRGSYSFIPRTEVAAEFPPDPDAFKAMHAARDWWRGMFGYATHDSLNRNHSWPGAKSHALSGLHLPDAPAQPAWERFDQQGAVAPEPPARLQVYQWKSARLENERNVWIYTTGESDDPAGRPLAILLDGQFWAQQMPVWQPLMQLTQEGKLPQAVYVLIDVIDTAHRSRELTCNPDFWRAVQEELLPAVAALAPHSDNAENTVVAGQSFGGLSALYAGLHWPQRFGCVLSQSGSFWWPRRDMQLHREVPQDAGWLLKQVEGGLGKTHPLNIFMEAGRHEGLIHHVNDQMADALQATTHHLSYRVVEGGHDALCWRGGLVDGLQSLWHAKVSQIPQRND